MGFRIDGYDQTSEYQGGNKVVPVRVYHVYSLPSETYFSFRRDKTKWAASNIKSVAQQLSDRIEAVLGLPNVTDVDYSQQVSQGGKLVDWMTTYYRTADEAISGSVESSLAQFGPNFTGSQVAKEISAGGDVIG